MSVALRIHLDELRQTTMLELLADVEQRSVALDVVVLHPKDFPSHRIICHSPVPVIYFPFCLNGEHVGTLILVKKMSW